ncbi:hypothetical protein [Hymenobacter cellulosilyticus]|uniref:Uncharacterized protein n=1 Tax=Hymenobacter cellulosilyticus TaxID=2932248 RepID=A0A8T9Q7L6_9BACT|nr:hypothetical protein [Hymenobacter cellulosilyticus]UOQ73576.1 hypothetical protein MUN79_06505 [Hymenobacter cellulosilyticus]
MKTFFALLLTTVTLSLQAEAGVSTAALPLTTTVNTDANTASDWGVFKRKKYKRKKRHNVNRSRYKRSGLFGFGR